MVSNAEIIQLLNSSKGLNGEVLWKCQLRLIGAYRNKKVEVQYRTEFGLSLYCTASDEAG